MVKCSMNEEPDIEERSSPLGYWNFANRFLEAGDIVFEGTRGTESAPVHYLYAHALELALKAFLRTQGVSIDVLKGKSLGHNLEKILEKAKSNGLESYIALTPERDLDIYYLNYCYQNKDFEYFLKGSATIPESKMVAKLVRDILAATKEICERSTLE